jgi:hypothetical protein
MILPTASATLGDLHGASSGYPSLLQFYRNGVFDAQQYLLARKRASASDDLFSDDYLELASNEEFGENDPPQQKEKQKRQKHIILARRSEDGGLEAVPPTESLWFNAYVSCPQTGDKRFEQKFRRRFRLPYESYLQFVEDAREQNWFPKWSKRTLTGENCSPLELLILGSLRYLGRGFTFDDCEESTAISEEVHRVFFHRFIEVGSTILFDKYVLTPTTKEELAGHTAEFEMAGCPGTPGSTDATSIIHEQCAWRLRRLHKGGKSKHPTRTYNMTVNHRRRILGSTKGHPGSWNDKTVVLFDTFIKAIKRGDILQDNIFELLEKRGDEIVKVKYRGVWLVVDNGYHSWSITVPPFKNTNFRDEIRWSEWIESMRKDVECAFGILKGRWRILKTGVRLHATQSVDQIWLTCCALHNMLLEVDGLNAVWDGKQIATSEWEGDLGRLESEDVPMAMRRVLNPSQIRNYDTTVFGQVAPPEHQADGQEDMLLEDGAGRKEGRGDGDGEGCRDDGDGNVRTVGRLSLAFFRDRLVEHFNIMFTRGELQWPSRRGKAPREV